MVVDTYLLFNLLTSGFGVWDEDGEYDAEGNEFRNCFSCGLS